MDAFKLLTRSTKLKSNRGAPAPASQTLPSTGKAQNPQLFHNAEADRLIHDAKHGRKRKRGSAGATDEVEAHDENDGELDFFASGKRAATTASTTGEQNKERKKKGSAGAAGGEAASDVEDEDADEEEDSMDEAQRRTVLNAHKIKVTDLRDLEQIPSAQAQAQAQTPAEQEPKKKKKKKSKREEKQEEEPKVLTKKELKKARRLFPQPLVSFKELRSKYKISRRLAENVAEQGFTVPTEVQLGTLPLQLGDRSVGQAGEEPDLLVVAPTGSGKTLSFLIPVINRIVRHHHAEPEERGIFSIVVAPTKELAGQIVNEGRKLVQGTGVKITLMKKGMRVVEREDEGDQGKDVLDEEESASESESEDDEPTTTQKKTKAQAPVTKSDILVTTPLILVNALSAHRTAPMAPLPLVRNLVLDEADVLLDPLFREQTLDIWRSCTHPELRASLWSATMGSNVEELAKATIQERKDLSGTTKSYPLIRLVVGLKDSAIPNIQHKLVYAATEQGKLLGLRQLLHPAGRSASDVHLRPPFLIFTQTIPRAVALHSELLYDIPPEAGGSSRIAVLHSDLSDGQRSEIMKGFRKGEIWILVTTDLLARGVDFRGINGVVNYDIPNSAAVYVHRVGRTGRAGREGGVAVTYYTKEDIPYVKSIANIIDVSEKLRGTEGEKSVQKWLLDSLPDLSKNAKKDLKKHGVKARQSNLKSIKDGGKDATRRDKISTKSGYERRLENKRKGAIAASRNRKSQAVGEADNGDDSWSGLED